MFSKRLRAVVLPALLVTAMGVTNAPPGTVTTIVDARLFTTPSGDNHLHGIVRDPVSGNIYVGDWNQIAVGPSAPFLGGFVLNKDSIRTIDALHEVSVVTYVVAPSAMAYNAADRRIYAVVGSISCNDGRPQSGATLNGVVAIDPATGKAHVLSGAQPGSANGTPAQARFSEPAGIASDTGSGAFFVSEGCSNRIRMVDAAGDAATLAGSGEKGTSDGTGLAAQFDDPRGIAYCEHEHTLYVADSGNNEIRAVDLNGKVTTLAGAPQPGFADGNGAAARFNRPTGVACDNAGNVYVADSQNNAVRAIAPGGAVTTLAGGVTAGSLDGVGTAAEFSTPGDLTYDANSNALYVVDWGSNQIRKVVVAVAAAQ